ncbi:MAG: ABC transporter ATP-binding protein [Lachnospiraceae bacterium]
MLQIDNLRKNFGTFSALDDLTLHVKEGELFGFVGPNGAGKTTTIKIITGLLKADAGSIRINNIDAFKKSKDVKKLIGYMPDYFGIYYNLKVKEYMEFYAATYGLFGLKARARSNELLKLVGLDDMTDHLVDGLSRGMKQRLCLARALIHSPSLLILDEPASGLDPRSRFEFKEILKHLSSHGQTIFITSHILNELSELCTSLGIIDKGKLLLQGTLNEIRDCVNYSEPIIISVMEKQEIAISLLQQNPYVQTISIDGPYIRIEYIGNELEEGLLLADLIKAGVSINYFGRQKGDLESIFMQVTGKKKGSVVLNV